MPILGSLRNTVFVIYRVEVAWNLDIGQLILNNDTMQKVSAGQLY